MGYDSDVLASYAGWRRCPRRPGGGAVRPDHRGCGVRQALSLSASLLLYATGDTPGMSEKILPRTIDEGRFRLGQRSARGRTWRSGGVGGVGSPMTSRLHRVVSASPEGLLTACFVKNVPRRPIRAFLDGVGAYTREVTFLRASRRSVPVRVPQPYAIPHASSSTDFGLVIEISPLDVAGLAERTGTPRKAAQRSARLPGPRVLRGSTRGSTTCRTASRRSTPTRCHDPHARGRAIRTGMATGPSISSERS